MAQHNGGDGVRLENLRDAPQLFERLFNDGALEGFVSLYEPEAAMIDERGREAVGQAAIRDVIAELMQGHRTFTINRRSALRSGDLVLAIYDWAISGVGPGDMRGRGAIVFRRQSDGTWLTVLDNMRACA